MKRKRSLVLGMILVFSGFSFVVFAATHPEASFPWGNRITYMLYGMYLWLLFKFLLDIPLFKRIRKVPSKDCLLRSSIYFLMAIVFFLWR